MKNKKSSITFLLLLFMLYGNAIAFDPAKDNITCSGSNSTCIGTGLNNQDSGFLFYWYPKQQGLLCGLDLYFYRAGSPSDDVLVTLYATGYPSASIDNISKLSIELARFTLDPLQFKTGTQLTNGAYLGLSPTHLDLSANLCTTIDDKIVVKVNRTGNTDNSKYAVLLSYNAGQNKGNWSAFRYTNTGAVVSYNFPAIVNITDNVGQIDPLVFSGYFAKPATSSLDNTNGFLQWLFVPSQNSVQQFAGLYDTIKNKPPFGYYEIIKNDFNKLTLASGSVTVPLTGFGAIFDPLKTGLSALLWFAFGVYVFKRIVHFEF